MIPPSEISREAGGRPCPECGGAGWVVGTDYEDECCNGSDWECGARGCTGPIQMQVPVQEQCEACEATGIERAHLENEHD